MSKYCEAGYLPISTATYRIGQPSVTNLTEYTEAEKYLDRGDQVNRYLCNMFPHDLIYSEKDEWIKIEGNVASIGISDYAQDALSDIVYLEYAISEGDTVSKGDIMGTVESVKAASDIYFPISGTIIKLNEELLDTPETINSDPYGISWMLKIEFNDPSELEVLMGSEKYEAYVQERL